MPGSKVLDILILGNVNYTAARLAIVLLNQPKNKIKQLIAFCEEDVIGDFTPDGFLSLLKTLCFHEGLQRVHLTDVNWPSLRLVALSVLLGVHKDTVSSVILQCITSSYFNDSLWRLLPGVAACSKITTIEFAKINLDTESVCMLSNASQSRKMPLLQAFRANGCNIDSAACIGLVQALSSGSCPRLQELSLKDNGLSASCIASFRSLFQMCPELQTVDIRGSHLFSVGYGSSVEMQLLLLAQNISRCHLLKNFLLFNEEAHLQEVSLLLPSVVEAFCAL